MGVKAPELPIDEEKETETKGKVVFLLVSHILHLFLEL
jgi:hypothetical protein